MKVFTIAALITLGACNQNHADNDTVLDDRISEQVHDATDEQLDNVSEEIDDVHSQLNEIEATQAELMDEIAKQKQSNDDLEARLSDVEQKADRLPD